MYTMLFIDGVAMPWVKPMTGESSTANPETIGQVPTKPTLMQATRLWLTIGLLSFGGPAAQIALMHRMLVDEKGWLDEETYLNALSFCMLLPGPEAMQLATYAGWRLHGLLGGLVAGLLFVLPGALIVLILAIIYVTFGDVPLVNALFIGIKAAVLIVVLEALQRVAKKALNGLLYWLIAGVAFVGIFFLALPFPLIVLGAGLVGYIIASNHTSSARITRSADHGLVTLIATVSIWLLLWALPFVAIYLINPDSLLLDIGAFFSRLAVVTFGGAYAVLAYMGQAVVDQFGWLSAGEMMDGLGLAETTPGPLILVTEFVGFIAAFREGGMGFGVLGALVALWMTFVPCFLWIFAGAPHIEWICSQPRLKSALTGISAAVVGVILNLSLWFALHVIFKSVTLTEYGWLKVWQPDMLSVDWLVVALSVVCALAIFVLRWSVLRTLCLASTLGVVASFL
ncbi:MAG: chromate transporter [Parasphingorhabdus sp.]